MNMFCYTCCVGFSGMGVVKVYDVSLYLGARGLGV